MSTRKYVQIEDLDAVNKRIDKILEVLTRKPETLPGEAVKPAEVKPAETGKPAEVKAKTVEKPQLRGTGRMQFSVYDGTVALHVDPLMFPDVMSDAVFGAFNGAPYYVNIRKDGRRVPKGNAHRCTQIGEYKGKTVKSLHAWYVIGLASDIDWRDAKARAEKAKSLAEKLAKRPVVSTSESTPEKTPGIPAEVAGAF